MIAGYKSGSYCIKATIDKHFQWTFTQHAHPSTGLDMSLLSGNGGSPVHSADMSIPQIFSQCKN